MIDATYRTIPQRGYRAIAGLSMGAGQAMQIGLTHLDTFSAIGAFSGGGRADPKTAYGGLFADPTAFDKRVSLLYLHAGTGEEAAHQGAHKLYQALQQAGIKNVAFGDAKGLRHEWQTWRYAVYDFAPRLFQQDAGKSERPSSSNLALQAKTPSPSSPSNVPQAKSSGQADGADGGPAATNLGTLRLPLDRAARRL